MSQYLCACVSLNPNGAKRIPLRTVDPTQSQIRFFSIIGYSNLKLLNYIAFICISSLEYKCLNAEKEAKYTFQFCLDQRSSTDGSW